MQPSHIFLITALIVNLGEMPLFAQTKHSSVEELANYLETGNPNQKTSAMDWLRWKYQSGENISAAVPALRVYVRQNVNPSEPLGVNKRGPTLALLYLMHYRDSQAIEHYLVAQKHQIARSRQAGRWVKLAVCETSEIPYLESIDSNHYELAYDIFSPAWDLVQKQRVENITSKSNQIGILSIITPLSLHWLGKFAKDKKPVVTQVNHWWSFRGEYLDSSRWNGFLPAVIVLADQPDLLPELVPLVADYSLDQIREESSGTVAMAVAMAPFRKDAYELFVKLLANPKLESNWDNWIALYVDSASRLQGEQKVQAWQQLIQAAKPAYDEIKGNCSWSYYVSGFSRPRFLKSRDELKVETLKAFGEGG